MSSPPANEHWMHPGNDVDDLIDMGEATAIEALRRFGQDAFACTDERNYPFPEMIRLGMFDAADAAVAAGYTAWARDTVYDSGADILASKGDDARLADLLRKHPPQDDNPWARKSIDRLWALCASAPLPLSLAELAKLSPRAPPDAWECAAMSIRYRDALDQLLSLTPAASMLESDTLCSIAEHGHAPIILAITQLPGFDAARFRSPWIKATQRQDSAAVRFWSASATRIPAEGWLPETQISLTAWSALCQSPKSAWKLQLDLRMAENLLSAGCKPSSNDLRLAYTHQYDEIALLIEQAGAKPTEECAIAAFKLFESTKNPSHISTLARWVKDGHLDILVDNSVAAGNNAYWRANLFRECAQWLDPNIQRDLCEQATDALLRSRLFLSGRAFNDLTNTIAVKHTPIFQHWISCCVNAQLSDYPNRAPMDWPATEAWLQAKALRLSLQGSPEPAPPSPRQRL